MHIERLYSSCPRRLRHTQFTTIIISQTPLRISFAGGGSDLPSYYLKHGGAIVSTTVNKYVYVTVSRKFDQNLRVSYSRTEEVENASQLHHPIVREAMGILGLRGGLEITSVADIPSRGTGLGSSSSFAVGLMHALHAIEGRHVSSIQLADEACRIEIDKCGEPIGMQDQYAAAFGGLNYIQFHKNGSVQVDPIVISPGSRENLNRHMLLFYTGITRSASDILASQCKDLAEQDKKVAAMHQMVAYAADLRDILYNGNLDAIGQILHENWRLKRTLTAGISSSKIDDWYDRGIKAGAHGGKLLGAGGGGFLLFYAKPEKHRSIQSELSDLRCIDFSLEPRGSRIIFVNQ